MHKSLLFTVLAAASLTASSQITFTNQNDLFTTTEVYSSHPVGVTDVNFDGLDDIVRLDDGNDLYINYQQTDGSFVEVYYGEIDSGGGWGGPSAWGMCVADLDGNGFADIMAGGSYDDIKLVMIVDEGDTMQVSLTTGESIFVQGANFFDINRDGQSDLFACHDDGPSEIIFNDGGIFIKDTDAVNAIFNTALFDTEEENSGNYGSVFSDINGDGYCDCYIAKCRQGVTDNTDVRRINQLWLYNPETSSYYEAGAQSGIDSGWQSWAADFGDIDNDGDMDMYVGNHDHANELFINDGSGVFTLADDASNMNFAPSFATIQTAMRDFDNDGWLDILVTGGADHVLAMNNGDMTFTIVEDAIPGDINSFALGDLNTDGFVDIVGVSGGYGGWGEDPDAIWMNEGNDNNWILVDLDGIESTAEGIGAKIMIEGPFGMMVREVKSGESYGIMNSVISHFGLGQDVMIDAMTVYWPSGIVDQITNVDANQTITIVEGTAVSIDERQDAVMQVFPNPVSENLRFNLSDNLVGTQLNVFDLQGKLVLNQLVNQASLSVDVQMLPEGVYNWNIIKSDQSMAEGKFAVIR